MVKIEPSKCRCGECDSEFSMEWEFEVVDIAERPQGECAWYHGEGEQECPKCGNILYGSFSATEYPAGILEDDNIKVKVSDSMETERSEVSEPIIRFFNL